MAPKKLTVADADWIVKNRYRNHLSSYQIYELLEKHRDLVFKNKGYRSSAQTLISISFSLWRAVFLSKLKKEIDSMIGDAESFLSELIDSNTITFNVDKERQDWSFRYYMSNAKYRLIELSDKFGHQRHPFNLWGDPAEIDPPQQWVDVQASLEAAIGSFSSILSEAAARKAFANVKKIKRRLSNQPK